MVEVFADTSGWGNFFVSTEPFHSHARGLMTSWQVCGTKVVTTGFVIAELVALLTSPLRVPRRQQVSWIETLESSPWIEIVHVDGGLYRDAWNCLRMRPDKEWSLVECTSFILMERRGIREALTTDHHFEQALFVRLLK